MLGAFGRKSSSEVPDPERRLLQLFRAKRTETLQNSPKHRFGSNRCYWVRSGEKSRRRFRTPEPVHLAPKHEFCNFLVPNVPKLSKILPNIILGLTEVIGCVRAKKLIGGSGPQNSAFGPETRVLQLFRAERTETVQNTPKHRFGSNGGYWVRSSEKARRRFRTPETVHSAPK